MKQPIVEDAASILNQPGLDGWATAMGIRYVRATADEVVAEIQIGPEHRQPYGIVHGGVYAGLIESLASVGAGMVGLSRGQSVVGLENHTTFLRACRAGVVRGVATPLTRGSRTQVWEGTIRDDQDRVLAVGRVRMLCMEAGSDLAGRPAALPSNDGG